MGQGGNNRGTFEGKSALRNERHQRKLETQDEGKLIKGMRGRFIDVIFYTPLNGRTWQSPGLVPGTAK